MRLIGILFAGIIVLAVVQLALKVVAIAIIVLALLSFLFRPMETLGCLTTFVILGLTTQYPLVMIPALLGLAALGALSKR